MRVLNQEDIASVIDHTLLRPDATYAGIKAAGGIRTPRRVLDMLKAGATRIGTSAGVKIMKDFKER